MCDRADGEKTQFEFGVCCDVDAATYFAWSLFIKMGGQGLLVNELPELWM